MNTANKTPGKILCRALVEDHGDEFEVGVRECGAAFEVFAGRESHGVFAEYNRAREIAADLICMYRED